MMILLKNNMKLLKIHQNINRQLMLVKINSAKDSLISILLMNTKGLI